MMNDKKNDSVATASSTDQTTTTPRDAVETVFDLARTSGTWERIADQASGRISRWPTSSSSASSTTTTCSADTKDSK